MMFGIYNINDPILLMLNINYWCFFSNHSCKGYLRIYGGECGKISQPAPNAKAGEEVPSGNLT